MARCAEIGGNAVEAEALALFAGYWKTLSILYLQIAGVSTPRGIVCTSAEIGVAHRIAAWARTMGFDSVTLRQDRSPELPTAPPAGNLVPLRDLVAALNTLNSQRRIPIALEPLDRFDNGHNVSLLFSSQDSLTLEVVGPGFDAADLQRGWSSPHEAIELHLCDAGESSEHQHYLVESRYQVSDDEYRESVERRLLRIGSSAAYAHRFAVPNSQDSLEVLDTLMRHGHSALSDHRGVYRPLPEDKLHEVVSIARKIASCTECPFERGQVVAASYVDHGQRLVAWDIAWPSKKYR